MNRIERRPRQLCLRLTLLGLAAAGLPGVAIAQATTYSYTGALYTSTQPPYAAGQRLTGSFTVAAPLPPFRALSDLTPALVAMSFHDGVEGRGLSDSFVCKFEVATDGAGAVTQWRILLRRSPYNPLDPQHSIDSLGNVGILAGLDFVGTGPAGAGPCDPIATAPAANSSAQGSWSSDHPLPSTPAVYTYTGAPYTTAAPPYVLGGQLAGTVTFANPLPAFLPLTDVQPALAGFSFSDGVESRTFANSFFCSFRVATDGAGAITRWQISLRRFPYNPGDPQHSIDTLGNVGFPNGNDFVGTGTAGVGPCDGMVLAPSANSSAQGSWSSSQPLPPDPTTYTYTGDPYTHADPPYSLGGTLQGSLTLAGPLPAFLPLTEVSSAIVDFAFDDGVEMRTLASSFLCSFEVATDGTGNITTWRIELRRTPYNPGDPHHGISTSGQPGTIQGVDFVGTGLAPANPCGPMTLSPAAGTASQGTWVTDHPLPSQPTLYRYTGDPYTTATSPYGLGGNLSGEVVLANPLPPFLQLTDITPAIVGFAFADDVATRQLADSFLCSFKVATDGAGAIRHWQIALREFPYTVAGPQHSIDSLGLADPYNGSDFVGTGPAAVNPCGAVILDPYAATSSRGTWTQESAASVVEVPALDGVGIAALAFALAGAALVVLRRRAPG
jgi:hypothetical protein